MSNCNKCQCIHSNLLVKGYIVYNGDSAGLSKVKKKIKGYAGVEVVNIKNTAEEIEVIYDDRIINLRELEKQISGVDLNE